jgi:hypothetical protein
MFIPQVSFLNFGRDVWNRGHIEKESCCVAFHVLLDMAQYALNRATPCQYQLAAVISHLRDPEEYLGHYITFVRTFGEWVRFDDTNVVPVSDSEPLEDNSPKREDCDQTATILLFVSDN